MKLVEEHINNKGGSMSRVKAVLIVAAVVALMLGVVLFMFRSGSDKQAEVAKSSSPAAPTGVHVPSDMPKATTTVPTKGLDAIQSALSSADQGVQLSVLEQEFAQALKDANVPLVPEGTTVELQPETFVANGANAQVQARVVTAAKVDIVVLSLAKQLDGSWFIQTITTR